MTHQRIILRPDGPVIDGAPGLPAELRNLSDETLADIEAATDPCPDDLVGIGYWRIQPPEALPAGHVETGRSVEMVEGQPGWVLTTAPRIVPPDEVDAERDRRIEAGFGFAGKLYQSRPEDRENIAGAAVAALAAIVAGAQPGDLRWHGGATDFAWIAADNSLVTMDAQTVFAFGQAAMAHKQAHIFAARALKDADPVPADYDDDAHWPA